eukprot:g1179.t1
MFSLTQLKSLVGIEEAPYLTNLPRCSPLDHLSATKPNCYFNPNCLYGFGECVPSQKKKNEEDAIVEGGDIIEVDGNRPPKETESDRSDLHASDGKRSKRRKTKKKKKNGKGTNGLSKRKKRNRQGIWSKEATLIQHLLGTDQTQFLRQPKDKNAGKDGLLNLTSQKDTRDSESEFYSSPEYLCRSKFPLQCPVDQLMPTGLINLGNTCYMNAQLQVLFVNKVLREQVYKWRPLASGENSDLSKLMYCLQSLFASMEFGRNRAFRPKMFIQTLGLNLGEQQDAQEFNKLFIGVLENIFAKARDQKQHSLIQNLFGGTAAYVTKCCHCGYESAREQSFYELSIQIPKPNLDGHKQDSIQNCALNTLVRGEEVGGMKDSESKPSSDRNRPSVQNALRLLFSTERLEGSNQYMCDKCNCKRDALRYFTVSKKTQKDKRQRSNGTKKTNDEEEEEEEIPVTTSISDYKLPPVLTLQVMRMVFDFHSLTRKKSSAPIDIPYSLNIDEILNEAHVHRSMELRYSKSKSKKRDNTEDKETRMNGKRKKRKRVKERSGNVHDSTPTSSFSQSDSDYQLFGILSHQGRSAYSGHYIAEICEKNENEKGTFTLYTFDDDTVTKCKMANEKENPFYKSSKDAYMLVYVHKDWLKMNMKKERLANHTSNHSTTTQPGQTINNHPAPITNRAHMQLLNIRNETISAIEKTNNDLSSSVIDFTKRLSNLHRGITQRQKMVHELFALIDKATKTGQDEDVVHYWLPMSWWRRWVLGHDLIEHYRETTFEDPSVTLLQNSDGGSELAVIPGATDDVIEVSSEGKEVIEQSSDTTIASPDDPENELTGEESETLDTTLHNLPRLTFDDELALSHGTLSLFTVLPHSRGLHCSCCKDDGTKSANISRYTIPPWISSYMKCVPIPVASIRKNPYLMSQNFFQDLIRKEKTYCDKSFPVEQHFNPSSSPASSIFCQPCVTQYQNFLVNLRLYTKELGTLVKELKSHQQSYTKLRRKMDKNPTTDDSIQSIHPTDIQSIQPPDIQAIKSTNIQAIKPTDMVRVPTTWLTFLYAHHRDVVTLRKKWDNGAHVIGQPNERSQLKSAIKIPQINPIPSKTNPSSNIDGINETLAKPKAKNLNRNPLLRTQDVAMKLAKRMHIDLDLEMAQSNNPLLSNTMEGLVLKESGQSTIPAPNPLQLIRSRMESMNMTTMTPRGDYVEIRNAQDFLKSLLCPFTKKLQNPEIKLIGLHQRKAKKAKHASSLQKHPFVTVPLSKLESWSNLLAKYLGDNAKPQSHTNNNSQESMTSSDTILTDTNRSPRYDVPDLYATLLIDRRNNIIDKEFQALVVHTMDQQASEIADIPGKDEVLIENHHETINRDYCECEYCRNQLNGHSTTTEIIHIDGSDKDNASEKDLLKHFLSQSREIDGFPRAKNEKCDIPTSVRLIPVKRRWAQVWRYYFRQRSLNSRKNHSGGNNKQRGKKKRKHYHSLNEMMKNNDDNGDMLQIRKPKVLPTSWKPEEWLCAEHGLCLSPLWLQRLRSETMPSLFPIDKKNTNAIQQPTGSKAVTKGSDLYLNDVETKERNDERMRADLYCHPRDQAQVELLLYEEWMFLSQYSREEENTTKATNTNNGGVVNLDENSNIENKGSEDSTIVDIDENTSLKPEELEIVWERGFHGRTILRPDICKRGCNERLELERENLRLTFEDGVITVVRIPDKWKDEVKVYKDDCMKEREELGNLIQKEGNALINGNGKRSRRATRDKDRCDIRVSASNNLSLVMWNLVQTDQSTYRGGHVTKERNREDRRRSGSKTPGNNEEGIDIKRIRLYSAKTGQLLTPATESLSHFGIGKGDCIFVDILSKFDSEWKHPEAGGSFDAAFVGSGQNGSSGFTGGRKGRRSEAGAGFASTNFAKFM